MDATRQQMSISAERLAMEKAEGKRMAEAAMASRAAQLSADQLAAEQEQITSALSGAAAFYQKGDRAGYDAWLAKLGLDPQEYAFDEFPAHAAMFEGVLEAMQTFAPPDQGDRYKVVGGSLFDLQAEGGPMAVGQGAMQEEVIMGPDGKAIVVKGGPGTTAKFTEGQSKDNVYATRAEGALAKLEPIADALTSRAGVVGDALGGVTLGLSREVSQSGDYQVARNAGDEFLQAILRKDTGAAITEGEQALYGKTYLPQPGDGPEVLQAKREARVRALEAIRAGMNVQQLEAVARAEQGAISRLGGAAPAAPAAPEAPAAPVGDFSTMGLAEIGQVDIGSLTPEQMDALEARMTELGL
jgi:hypothetical protein